MAWEPSNHTRSKQSDESNETRNRLQRVAEAATQNQPSRYADLFELAPVGYVTTDDHGVVLDVNLRAADLFGTARTDLTGHNLKFWIVPEDQDIFYSACHRLQGRGLREACELRMCRRDGAVFFARLQMARGRVDGAKEFQLIVDDITDSKMAELQLRQTERHLQRQVDEGKTLAREVHHRVKNNLQVISSLLRMQAELLRDDSASATLKQSQQRILSMANIHERLYQTEITEHIDFGEYTRALVNELFDSFSDCSGRVTRRLNASRVILNSDQAIACGLILSELVTNALKYAYPNGRSGEIMVDLEEHSSGTVRLAVSDQGVGLPAQLDWGNSDSIGLPIVDVLAKQIGGSLEVCGSPGASFVVQFPKEVRSLVASG